MPGFTSTIKKKVLDRDKGRCVVCGTESGIDVHHRAGRGAGGSRSANVLSNLVLACRYHNDAMESDSAFMGLAYEMGWKCYRNRVALPSSVPIFYASEREWFLLGDDGSRLIVEAPHEAA